MNGGGYILDGQRNILLESTGGSLIRDLDTNLSAEFRLKIVDTPAGEVLRPPSS